jgi:hypothetical protein
MKFNDKYLIEVHKHKFAVWTASSAARASKNCRFSVELGKSLIECTELGRINSTAKLPAPNQFDSWHENLRDKIVDFAKTQHSNFTHGVAAKLINVYLKTIFTCGGFHEDNKVKAIHPPIDSLLLKGLSECNFADKKKIWNEARKKGWSNFDSGSYQRIIDEIRNSLSKKDPALWEVEKYWQGHQ